MMKRKSRVGASQDEGDLGLGETSWGEYAGV